MSEQWPSGEFFLHKNCPEKGVGKLISVSEDRVEMDFSRTGYMRMAKDRAIELLTAVDKTKAAKTWSSERNASNSSSLTPFPSAKSYASYGMDSGQDYYGEIVDMESLPLSRPGTGRRAPDYLKKMWR